MSRPRSRQHFFVVHINSWQQTCAATQTPNHSINDVFRCNMTSKWNPIFRLLETMLLISWRTHSFTYKMWFDHEVNAQTHRKRAQKGTAHIFKYYIHIDSEKKNVMMRSSLYIPIAFVISHKWYCLSCPRQIFSAMLFPSLSLRLYLMAVRILCSYIVTLHSEWYIPVIQDNQRTFTLSVNSHSIAMSYC